MADNPNDLSTLTVPPSARIRDAMAAIDQGARQIALVVDSESRLVATITDGDIRRGLLRGLDLEAPAVEIMNRDFTAVLDTEGREEALRVMQAKRLHQVPIVTIDGRLVDLALVDDIPRVAQHDTRVVLMAGGLGTRLRPLTETVPKPMLPVGGRPILELILRNFTEQGFHNFTISLNYQADVIQDHFKDGSEFGANIDYVREDKRMGTAGALSLLEKKPDAPFIVMNADLLTSLAFDSLVRFHGETGSTCTMCARDYSVQIPYGVIEVEETSLRRVVEKPTYSHFVNAGIYVLSPEALDHVTAGEYLDMPTLFDRIIDAGRSASVYPIREYWIDIGRHEDLERARVEVERVFGK